jgi:hypothetical protein
MAHPFRSPIIPILEKVSPTYFQVQKAAHGPLTDIIRMPLRPPFASKTSASIVLDRGLGLGGRLAAHVLEQLPARMEFLLLRKTGLSAVWLLPGSPPTRPSRQNRRLALSRHGVGRSLLQCSTPREANGGD